MRSRMGYGSLEHMVINAVAITTMLAMANFLKPAVTSIVEKAFSYLEDSVNKLVVQ